jgi:hypothetical protein
VSWLKKNWWAAGLLLALAVVLLSPLASRHPDGLARVANDQGISSQERESPVRVIPRYLFPGIQDERLATIVSGLLGVAVVFGVVVVLGRLARSREAGARDTGSAARGQPAPSGDREPPEQ